VLLENSIHDNIYRDFKYHGKWNERNGDERNGKKIYG
jgi:hypothetical protein